MIYRPHFTYIAAGTPEQTQAREAAANEEWRKRLIFHPIKLHIVTQPRQEPSPPRPISLPRPPPIYNPPIHGVARAPIYSPPGEPVVKRPIPEEVANEESHPGFLLLPHLKPEPNPSTRESNPEPIVKPPIREPIIRPRTLEPLRRLSIGIPQRTGDSSSPSQQTVAQESQSNNPLGAIGSFFGSIVNGVSNTVKDVENAVTSGVTNAAKDVGNAVTGALSTANNAIQNAYGSVYGGGNQQAQNPLQQFFNDVADVSALVGYYATEGVGGVGEELNHLVTGKGLENFGQAVSQFNKAGGQNVAKTVGDITEVALPAIATVSYTHLTLPTNREV